MKIGVVSELTGGSDICRPVTDLAALQATQYLAPGEVVLFALSSPKEEYAFTNEALVAVCGDSAMSTKRSVARYEFVFERVAQVAFETCGVTDRDCELKFHMGAQAFSIDIARAEQTSAQRFYRVLLALGRAQAENARVWEFARTALESAVRATRITQVPESYSLSPSSSSSSSSAGAASSGGAPTCMLVDQAASVQTWLQDAFAKTNPRCYRAVIQSELERGG